MSTVYLATDKVSHTQVALKLYHKKKLNALNRHQVDREIRIHANLDHESIIKMYAAFETEEHLILVLELAARGDLHADVALHGGSMDEAQAVSVLVPLMDVLTYLHDQHIIHRDIKPENLLLSSAGAIKLADFGLAINASMERPVTRAGTFAYMAPETYACPYKTRPAENKELAGLAYTEKVDIWAVGILAYELLTGASPFEDKSGSDSADEAVMTEAVEFPAFMSADAISFIELALVKDPQRRPSIRQLAAQRWIQNFREKSDAGESAAGNSTDADSSRTSSWSTGRSLASPLSLRQMEVVTHEALLKAAPAPQPEEDSLCAQPVIGSPSSSSYRSLKSVAQWVHTAFLSFFMECERADRASTGVGEGG